MGRPDAPVILPYFFSQLRIHLSDTTASLLKNAGGYDLEYRGEMPVKVRLLRQAAAYLISALC